MALPSLDERCVPVAYKAAATDVTSRTIIGFCRNSEAAAGSRERAAEPGTPQRYGVVGGSVARDRAARGPSTQTLESTVAAIRRVLYEFVRVVHGYCPWRLLVPLFERDRANEKRRNQRCELSS